MRYLLTILIATLAIYVCSCSDSKSRTHKDPDNSQSDGDDNEVRDENNVPGKDDAGESQDENSDDPSNVPDEDDSETSENDPETENDAAIEDDSAMESDSDGGSSDEDSDETINDQDVVSSTTSLSDLADERDSKFVEALEKVGIETAEDLFEKVNSIGKINELVEKLQKEDETADTGKVVHLLKNAERAEVLDDIKESGELSEDVVEKVEKTGFSVATLKDMLIIHPNTSVFRNGAKSPDDLLKEQQLSKFNNLLAELGIEGISLDDFAKLRESFKDVKGKISRQLYEQSVQKTNDGKSDPDAPVEAVVESLLENSESPEAFLGWQANSNEACKHMVLSYPVKIVSADGSASHQPPFSFDKVGSDYRQFFLPDTGMALIAISSQTEKIVTILNSDEDQIFSGTVSGTKYLKIPVFNSTVCTPFYVTKGTDVTLVRIEQIKKVYTQSENPSEPGILFSFDSSENTEMADSIYLTFDMATNSVDTDVAVNIKLNKKDEFTPDMEAILISPSNKSYKVAVVEGGFTSQIKSENGRWDLFIAQKDTLTISLEKKIAAISLSSQQKTAFTVSGTIDFAPVRTKEFVLGILEFAAFSRDGESEGERGEISITMSANMAPANNVDTEEWNPEKVGTIGMYDAYKCWKENKEPWPFVEGGACADHIAGFNEIQTEDRYDPGYYCYGEFCSIGPWDPVDWMRSYAKAVKLDQNLSTYDEAAKNYTNQYLNWLKAVVQINNQKFPNGPNYGITDSTIELSGVESTGFIPQFTFNRFHPVVPVDMPFFGVPKEHIKDTTLPLTFDYSAIEKDKLDKGALFGAFVRLVINSAISIAELNFIQGACGVVNFMSKKRELEKAAQDDPIGNANFKLSRYSIVDSFYGLEDDNMEFFISGFSKELQQEYSLYEKGLNYAKLACAINNTDFTNPVSVAKNFDELNGSLNDVFYGGTEDLESVKASIIASNPTITAGQMSAIESVFADLENGTLEENYEAMLLAIDILGSATSGNDLFLTKEDLLSNISNIGGAAKLGYNLSKSQAYFHFNSYERRKTQGKVNLKIVRSLPVKSLKVTLDEAKIYNVMEKGTWGEVYLQTRVGVVSDGTPTYDGFKGQFVQNGVPLYANGKSGYMTHDETPFRSLVKLKTDVDYMRDGEVMSFKYGGTEPRMMLFNASYADKNNTAAIFVEIGAYDDDGDNIDDDMIGVYSKTFLLEDFFAKDNQYKWEKTGENKYRITVEKHPVYDPYHLATLVEVGRDAAENQMKHNRDRLNTPSATFTFHIDIELGEIENSTAFDTKFEVEEDPSPFNFNQVNPTTDDTHDANFNYSFVGMGETRVLTKSIDGTMVYIYEPDVETKSMNFLYRIDKNVFPNLFGTDKFVDVDMVNDDFIAVLSKDSDKSYISTVNISQNPPVVVSNLEIATAKAVKIGVSSDGSSAFVATEDATDNLKLFEIDAIGTLTAADTETLPYKFHTMQSYDEGVMFITARKLMDDFTWDYKNRLILLKNVGGEITVMDMISFDGKGKNLYKTHQRAYPAKTDNFGAAFYAANKTNKVFPSELIFEWYKENDSYFFRDPLKSNETVNNYDDTSFIYNMKKGKRHPEHPFFCRTSMPAREECYVDGNLSGTAYLNCLYADLQFNCYKENSNEQMFYDRRIRDFEYLPGNSNYIVAIRDNRYIELINLFHNPNPDCAENEEKIETCETDETKLQKFVCSSEGVWEKSGECYTDTQNANFPRTHAGNKWSLPSQDYMTLAEAKDYCGIIGGRVPTISELRTLVTDCANSETGGACNTTDECLDYSQCWTSQTCSGCGQIFDSGKNSVFKDISWFWSLSVRSDGDGTYNWFIDFDSGEIGQGPNNSNGRVICIEDGQTNPQPPSNWSEKSTEKMNWADAVSYCDNLREDDYSAWTLPTVNELRTLLTNCPDVELNGSCGVNDDCTQYQYCWSNACDCGQETGPEYSVFGETDRESLWSSVTDPGTETYAWYVGYGSATIRASDKTAKLSVRCIRRKWSEKSPTALKWNEVGNYCRSQPTEPNRGWFWPSIDDLRSLVKECPATETGGSCTVTNQCYSQDSCFNAPCTSCSYDYDGKYSILGDNEILISQYGKTIIGSTMGNYGVDYRTGQMVLINQNSTTGYVRCVERVVPDEKDL